MATYSSILAWRMPWTEKPRGLLVCRVAKSWTKLKRLSTHTSHSNSWFHEQPISFLLFSYQFYVLLFNRGVCVREREMFLNFIQYFWRGCYGPCSVLFELWCWRRLLRVPWIARSWIQSILKEINPEYSLELKLRYSGHLMQRTDSEKTLMLGKIEGRRRRGQQRVRWLDGIAYWVDIPLSKLRELVVDRGVGDGQGSLGCCSPWCSKESDTTERLSWTE